MSRAYFFLVGHLASGCVSTDVQQDGFTADCGNTAEPSTPADAIVRVDADLGSGRIICSGVAIAETLVVTALGCIMRPSRWADPNPSADPMFGNPALFDTLEGSAAYEDVCRRGGAWTPLEDGSLSGRLGKPVEASALSVFRVGGERLVPTRVVTSRAASRCADGIALLVFDQGLDVVPLPVRLDDESALDERMTLSGYCRADPQAVVTMLDSKVQGFTSALGTEQLPPRALWLTNGVSNLEVGGAISSAETGALVGVVASGGATSCARRDPTGSTIGIRVAPFRRMLLETAAEEKVQLRLERLVEPVSANRVDCRQ